MIEAPANEITHDGGHVVWRDAQKSPPPFDALVLVCDPGDERVCIARRQHTDSTGEFYAEVDDEWEAGYAKLWAALPKPPGVQS